MTTLYKPVLIESAEQAEALPVDTIARKPNSFFCQKLGEGEWLDAGHASTWSNADMIGWTALVPIEAEEKYGAEMKWDAGATHDTHVSLGLSLDNARWQAENNPDYATGRIMRQYRTPWEEA